LEVFEDEVFEKKKERDRQKRERRVLKIII